MQAKVILKESVNCRCCAALLGDNLVKHYRKVHEIVDFRLRLTGGSYSASIPECVKCSGANRVCDRCKGTGAQVETFSGNAVICPVCKGLSHKDMLLAHLIADHSDCFLNANFPPFLQSPKSLSKSRVGRHNRAVMLEQQKRKAAMSKDAPQYAMSVLSKVQFVKSTICPDCLVPVEVRLLDDHMKSFHGPTPKHQIPKPKAVQPARIPSASYFAMKQNSSSPSVYICPRCSGNGGARNGCQKCDGTGWVSVEDAPFEGHTLHHEALEGSKVSNADYVGNSGGHFRERDGRIGSIPLHDDYSDESE